MQDFKDLTELVDEPKSARMEQRTKPHIKAEIQKAAALLGVDESTFVMSVAYERARETIRGHEQTLLSEKDRNVFLAALDAPAKPTKTLRDAVKRSARVVRNAG